MMVEEIGAAPKSPINIQQSYSLITVKTIQTIQRALMPWRWGQGYPERDHTHQDRKHFLKG